jgi:tetratricopeptide (TPR) repeat protein
VDAALAIRGLDAVTARELQAFRESVERERQRSDELEARIRSGEATPEEHAELARILAGRGQWLSAAELQRVAPPSTDQREILAYMLFEAGRFREAHEIWGALAEESGRASLRLNDGVALALLGDDQAAAQSFRRVLEAEPQHDLARLYLANALLRLGDVRPAAESYKAYLDVVGEPDAAERVRRILQQIAPDLLPAPTGPLVPEPLPPRPPEPDEEDPRS